MPAANLCRYGQLMQGTATQHKLAAVIHLQAPERQIGYCTSMKTVAYTNKFNNNIWFQSVVGHSC